MATRVFLLSADEKAVHVITQILDEQDIRFEHSSDATFTLKRLAGQHFDVLVIDCDNADSAMQVFNSARASNLNKGAIAVAIVEGKAGVPNAFRLGASLVLTKPVSLDQARNTLRTAVGMTKKDAVEPRPVVMPPTPSFSAVPAPTTHAPAHAAAPVSAPASAVVSTAPVAPIPIAAVASPSPAPAARAVPAAFAPTPASPLPSPPVSAAPSPQPITTKPLDLAPAKITLTPSAGAEIAVKESNGAEKISSAPVAAAPKPALQLSETRVVTPEEEIPSAKAVEKAAPGNEKSSVSLSSAMLGSSESKAAIDKLESALSGPKPEFKTSNPIEMFAPAAKDVREPELDDVSDEPADSMATLRAGAVPAFGGLAQQPFAGINPAKGTGRGLLVGGLISAMAVAGFAGAWFYAPGFQKTVLWEYARVHEQLLGSPAKPVTTMAISKPASAPASIPAAVPPPDATTNPAANVPGTPTTSSQASTSPAPMPTASTTPAPTSASTGAVAPASQTPPTSRNQLTSPGPSAAVSSSASASLVSTSLTSASTAKPADLFEVPEDYADDQVIHRVHPAYPNAARTRKLQGSVVLQAIINKQGKVDSLQLVSGDPLLAQAAADAVKQWRYKPYSHNGDPVEFQTRVTVDFKLP